jgi:hypothetical protein
MHKNHNRIDKSQSVFYMPLLFLILVVPTLVRILILFGSLNSLILPLLELVDLGISVVHLGPNRIQFFIKLFELDICTPDISCQTITFCLLRQEIIAFHLVLILYILPTLFNAVYLITLTLQLILHLGHLVSNGIGLGGELINKIIVFCDQLLILFQLCICLFNLLVFGTQLG